ncbi:MAG TPA: type II secretion system F family protein [Terracidiphilus sp.]|nr:type II secretion system F family protein [Terracidiphilus sp.]
MGFAVIAFSVVFLLIASGGLLLFYRDTIQQRISAVLYPRAKQRNLAAALEETRTVLGGVVEQFERVLPKSQAEISVVQQRLIRAGYRKDSAVKSFYGAKVLTPVVLLVLVWVSGLASLSPFFVYAVAIGMGFLAPDFWLGRQISKRQSAIKRGLPDVLDLLIICIEAGLSLDQATARTGQELAKAQPALSDELGIVALEQRAGRPRAEAWKHLAERTDVDVVRNLVSMLIQAEQFGTSIGKTLRVHSDTLRTQRIQEIEEKAAKLSVKLVFPLVLFIFPSLFLVTLGPALISMSQAFKNLFH